ncbi:hypothetical protein SERLADRAFT_444201 [Serpula lacrymans var. lacrymans S7.9]|uniref:Uncharacterized protein n=1 Tax=Serpula lacrymans var. lacrymans (strain S7.9) TaxID=578457 RepID=F8PER7_SERL9|nr:uncharacterized protein SERLADRAFT_444201 [Serpula lacrymans var. lacrymans S7.9]EGO18379.1 hypothetical protein SERLADRAFT_444201 [Serpula lacrymans var. lacrymans S7.9]
MGPKILGAWLWLMMLDEQEVCLQALFENWAEKGGLWSAAASKNHGLFGVTEYKG